MKEKDKETGNSLCNHLIKCHYFSDKKDKSINFKPTKTDYNGL